MGGVGEGCVYVGKFLCVFLNGNRVNSEDMRDT